MTIDQHPMTRGEIAAYIESLPVAEIGRIILERMRRRKATLSAGETADVGDYELIRAHQAGALPWQSIGWEPCLPNAKRTYNVLDLVAVERARQRALFKEGKIPFDCAAPNVNLPTAFPVLVEEVGEVAQALQAKDRTQMRIELIQVAAVAVALVEALEAP